MYMFIGSAFFCFHNVCFIVFSLVLTYLLYEGLCCMIWDVLKALFFKLWIAVWQTVFYDLSICIYRDLKTKMSLFVSPGTAIVTSHSRKSRQVSSSQPRLMSKCKLVFSFSYTSSIFKFWIYFVIIQPLCTWPHIERSKKIKQVWINDLRTDGSGNQSIECVLH